MQFEPNRSKVRDVTEMKLIQFLSSLGVTCLFLALFLGFAGRVHPVFDSLSLFRLPLAALCLMALVIPMRLRLRAVLASAMLLSASTTVPVFFQTDTSNDMRIYSKNIWFANRNLDALADDIRESDADVVALQEVSNQNLKMLADLSNIYHHQHVCPFSGWSRIAVLSKEPIIATACTERRAVAAAQVRHPSGPVWVASVHLGWPFPYNNAASAASGSALLKRLDGPVVMAGDFNIFPWAASVGRLQATADLEVAQPVRATFQLGRLPLFLDHVHAPGGGSVAYRDFLGSDHRGVLADIALSR